MPSANRDWQVDPAIAQSVLSLDSAQLVLNAVAIGLDCLPRSGKVGVALEGAEAGPIKLTVDIHGPSVRIREEVTRVLAGPLKEDDLSVRAIHAILLRMVAARVGCDVDLTEGESRVTLTVAAIPNGSGS